MFLGSGEKVQLGNGDLITLKENCPDAPDMQLMVVEVFVKGADQVLFLLVDSEGNELAPVLPVVCHIHTIISWFPHVTWKTWIK